MNTYIILAGIPEEWGGVIFVFQNGKSKEEWGLHEIPSVVSVWIFSGTTHNLIIYIRYIVIMYIN